MLRKTAGLADVVRSALMPVRSSIDIAVIYGSITSGKERSESDVDVMIVGEVNLADLSIVLRPLEDQLGRSVNVSVYTTHEFLKKLSQRNHFIGSVLKTELLFIFGTANDLARLVERATRKGS
jgi:predicted nucleotidyltransferase